MNSQKHSKLIGERFLIQKKMDTCWNIYEYGKLGKLLEKTEKEILIMEKGHRYYAAYVKLSERIDELESNKARAMIERKSCKDPERYRKLFNSIELIDQSIEITKRMIKELA